jgi:hypothetical protein
MNPHHLHPPRLIVFMLSLVAVSLAGTSTHAQQPSQRAAEKKYRENVAKAKAAVPVPGAAAAATTLAGAENAKPAELFPSYDLEFTPPQGTPIFQLSQDYPPEYKIDEVFPWSDIDYRVNPTSYMKAVLGYCLEGNTDVDFRGQDNGKRKWYHAPWMHNDSENKQEGRRQGREYHHGLTRERRSRARELHPLQVTDRVQNWAVSLYNDRGGYTIGKTWLTPDGFPDPSNATFPDHAVSFKLLFTAASVAEVPYLKGSFKWTANINPSTNPPAGTPFNRVDQEMHLLQLDVAVKDPRAATDSGWVFGTFVYDASQSGATPWDRLVLVGVSWGDDSMDKRMIEKDGSFLNPILKQSSLNASLLEPAEGSGWGHRAYLRHFGLGGRLNGPVDNPSSSCISCHGRAGVYAASLPLNPNSGFPMPILAGKGAEMGSMENQRKEFTEFFRDIRPNSHLEKAPGTGAEKFTYVTVDYSLQISQGIRNYYQALRTNKPAVNALNMAQEGAFAPLNVDEATIPLPSVSRGD